MKQLAFITFSLLVALFGGFVRGFVIFSLLLYLSIYQQLTTHTKGTALTPYHKPVNDQLQWPPATPEHYVPQALNFPVSFRPNLVPQDQQPLLPTAVVEARSGMNR